MRTDKTGVVLDWTKPDPNTLSLAEVVAEWERLALDRLAQPVLFKKSHIILPGHLAQKYVELMGLSEIEG